MLSFDDYSPSWEAHLELFARYQARVTFYVSGTFLLDPAEIERRLGPLVRAGHAIGVHTVNHLQAPEAYARDPRWLDDEVLVAKTNLETALGTRITAFAYPHGAHTAALHDVLAPHFAYIRRFRNDSTVYGDGDLVRTPRVLDSTSIDSIKKRSSAFFTEQLAALARSRCGVWPVTSHGIDDTEWGITPSALDAFLADVTQRGLRFYIPEDFA